MGLLEELSEITHKEHSNLEEALKELHSRYDLPLHETPPEKIEEIVKFSEIAAAYELFEEGPLLEICREDYELTNFIDLCGRICAMFGLSDRSIKIRNASIKLFLSRQDFKAAAKATDYAAEYMNKLGCKEEALEKRIQAAEFFEKAKLTISAGYSYSYAARLSSELGDFDKAMKYKDLAYTCFINTANKNPLRKEKILRDAATQLVFYAQFAVAKGDFEKAVDALLRTESPLIEVGNRDLAAENLDLAVNYLLKLERYDEAAELAETVANYSRQSRKLLANVMEAKAKYLQSEQPKPL